MVGVMMHLGVYVRWTSVHYSTMGASVPICDACRESYYAYLNRIARIDVQGGYMYFRPPLMHLSNCSVELWQAYRIVAKLLASQLYTKLVQLHNAVRPMAD